MKQRIDFDLYYRVIYDGELELVPFTTEGSEKVSDFVTRAEQEHVRLEVRYKRMRLIYYFDYDRPRTKQHVSSEVSEETSDRLNSARSAPRSV